MNCQKASNLLSAFIDHELCPEERRLLRLHLMVCDECAEELHQLEEVKNNLGRLAVVHVPAVLLWLRAHLAAETAEAPPAFIWQYPWFRRTCAAIALLLLFGLGSWLLTPQRRNGPTSPQNPLPQLPDASWVGHERILP